MLRARKIWIWCLIMLCANCFAFFAFSAFGKTTAKADAAALEAEFTNDGQFEIKASAWGDAFEFIDGTSVGGTGAVLKITRNAGSGTAAFKLDFTGKNIRASSVSSIVIRIKATNFTVGTDEFRTDKNAGSSWVNYGKNVDLNNWYEYSLNATTMAQLTNEDGTLGSTNIAIRAYTSGLIAYVDSITLVPSLASAFTNDGQFDILASNWNDTFEFIDGTSVGGTGAVLKVLRHDGTGTATVKLDLSPSGLRAVDVQSIVIRVKAENFVVGTDEFRTSKATGADWVNYGKTDSLSDWHEYTLNAASMAQLTNADGTLGSTDIGIRTYSAGLIMYIDSITIVPSYATEFTNDGQFAILSSAWGDTFEYIDGASVGGTGAVLKVLRHDGTGTASFRFDLSSSGLRAADISSIVIRVKADNFVLGTDEFKTSKETGSDWVNYGKTDDLNDWHEYTLSAGTMAQLTNQDGSLGYTDIAIRTYSAGLIMYVDSITITAEVSYESQFTNNGQFAVGNTNWGTTHEFIDGTTVGGTGAVLKADTSAGIAGFKLDFTGKNLYAADVASIVVRVKATNFVLGTDFFRTALDTSSAFVDYGKTDDLNNWHEYTLNAASMAQLTNQDGTLGSVDLVIRSYAAGVIVYFDSITINEVVIIEPNVVCQGIANDVNNNILESGAIPKYRTLLKYDVALGSLANSTNVVSTTGQGILLNGVALSEIPNASIDYGHGSKYIQIRIPQSYQDNLVDEADEVILEVIAGTAFESKILDYAKFALIGGQWVTYQEPQPITFAAIFWNNAGGDVYAGKNGILLSYSEYLSAVPNQANGGIKEENLVGDGIGEKIKLDGVALANIAGAEIMYFGASLLWIYVPNMDTYKELTIESTEFLMVILPETHFALFDGKWAESFKITHTINGVEEITYCKKNGATVLGEKYYAELFADKDLAVKLISFEVNDTVYSAGQTLTVNEDVCVAVKVVGFETVVGAYVRLLNPTGIRFETRINKADYDYLVSVYGENNLEMGTYILPKKLLGLTAFGDYFADETKTEDNMDYVKIVNQGFANEKRAETDGYYKYYGSLVNIQSHNYCTEFFGIGYIKITDGLNEYVLYGGSEIADYTRSIYDVSTRAYNDFQTDSREERALRGYLDGVVSIIGGAQDLEIESGADGYTSPYSIDYDDVSGEYTVSGGVEIKSVLINGLPKKMDSANLIEIGDKVYKLTNLSQTTAEFSFKLSPVVKASDMVDFTVQIPSDREMRILQLTDTQIIDSSQMRSSNRLAPVQVETWSRANIDKNCFNYITELIENERPDLILLTGDIVYGEFDDSGEILTLIVEFMDSFGIPWAPIFGNHDNESAKGVAWQCAQFEGATNCLFKTGNLSGNGNYSIGLVDASGKIRRVIYMLDSHGSLNSQSVFDPPNIAADQISWFKSVSAAIDLAYGEEVPAFACYHIPSLDFQTAYVDKYGYAADIDKFNLDSTGTDGDYGQKNQQVCMINLSYASDLKAANVDGVFVGHDHLNNYSILYDGIRYTYGTKTGTYDEYEASVIGGTLIRVSAEGGFEVLPKYLNKEEMESKQSASLTITFMSDIHFDEKDYGDFHCTQAEAKLKQIVSETPGSRFYVNLGDTVNSLPDGNMNNMYDAISTMKELDLNVYNSDGTGYDEDNRMIYNLCGNHEAAYVLKSELKDYIPYVEDVGTVGVFKYEDLMFVMVDALFDSNGADDPATVFETKFFTIPDVVINWITAEVASQMDETVKGIVLLNHVALQDIDDSKYTLLNAIKGYGLPMTIFDGHTHAEAYHELTDSVTGEVYCTEYTLPAVTLNSGYPYYSVTFKDGKVWYVDKHTTQTIG